MIERYTHNNFTWLDIVSPTRDEVKGLMETYGIHPRIAEQLLDPSLKPWVDAHGKFVYVVLHFPASRHSKSVDSNQEVNFIVGDKVLLTTRYDTIDSIHKFGKEFEVHASLNNEHPTEVSYYIFYRMLQKLYHSVEHELEYIESSLNDIEESIFKGKEKEMVFEISVTSRVLLDFKKSIKSHTHVLGKLSESISVIGGKEASILISKVILEQQRIKVFIQTLQEMVDELRHTNNSLLSTKQNEVMKVLTIMAFTTFPLSLIAAIFGMNAANIPIVGDPNDFWIILGLMLVLMLSFFIFFKHKNWL